MSLKHNDTLLICSGVVDLSSSLKSAAGSKAWKTENAEKLIELCGGVEENWDNIYKVSLKLINCCRLLIYLILSLYWCLCRL